MFEFLALTPFSENYTLAFLIILLVLVLIKAPRAELFEVLLNAAFQTKTFFCTVTTYFFTGRICSMKLQPNKYVKFGINCEKTIIAVG